MMGRAERRKADKLRSHELPPASASTGIELMEAQAQATDRYINWANDTVAAMKLGDPKEGHQWVVDPRNRRVRELPVAK
jgi:hypothetical protein